MTRLDPEKPGFRAGQLSAYQLYNALAGDVPENVQAYVQIESDPLHAFLKALTAECEAGTVTATGRPISCSVHRQEIKDFEPYMVDIHVDLDRGLKTARRSHPTDPTETRIKPKPNLQTEERANAAAEAQFEQPMFEVQDMGRLEAQFHFELASYILHQHKVWKIGFNSLRKLRKRLGPEHAVYIREFNDFNTHSFVIKPSLPVWQWAGSQQSAPDLSENQHRPTETQQGIRKGPGRPEGSSEEYPHDLEVAQLAAEHKLQEPEESFQGLIIKVIGEGISQGKWTEENFGDQENYVRRIRPKIQKILQKFREEK